MEEKVKKVKYLFIVYIIISIFSCDNMLETKESLVAEKNINKWTQMFQKKEAAGLAAPSSVPEFFIVDASIEAFDLFKIRRNLIIEYMENNPGTYFYSINKYLENNTLCSEYNKIRNEEIKRALMDTNVVNVVVYYQFPDDSFEITSSQDLY